MSTTQQDESPSLALHVLLRGSAKTDAEKQAQKHAQDSIRAWWTALSPSDLSTEDRYKKLADFARLDRGDRAELRRSVNPYDAANSLAVHLLAKRLYGADYTTSQLLDLAWWPVCWPRCERIFPSKLLLKAWAAHRLAATSRR